MQGQSSGPPSEPYDQNALSGRERSLFALTVQLASYDGRQRERARHYGVPAEPINRLQYARLLKAQDERCALCGGALDLPLEAKPYGAMMASVDHIVPLVRGGGHVLANLQLAHRACNISKNGRVPRL